MMMKSILLLGVVSVAYAQDKCVCGGVDTTEVITSMQTLMEMFGAETDFEELCLAVDEESGETETLCKYTSGDGCFPATAEIEFEGGAKQMGSITVGDKVHVGSSRYSDVYYFSTAMEDTMSKFVSLATADTKKPLLLTRGKCLLNL